MSEDTSTCPACGERCTHPWHTVPDDEWLEAAAAEIVAHRWTSPLDGDDKPLDVLAILRKHRDGA